MKLLETLRAWMPARGRSALPVGDSRHAEGPPLDEGELLEALLHVLREERHEGKRVGHELWLPSGLRLRPELLETVQLGPAHFRTFTRITATHPQVFPAGLPEFQHAAGNSVLASLRDGFNTWARMDLVTLEDALRAQPRDCTVMDMKFPLPSGRELHRQVLLGPVGHLAAAPERAGADEHPFCPCCLLSSSLEAFQEPLRTERFVGIRLFASRDAHGQVGADCRINGEPFEPGAQKLAEYVGTWPDRGLEFRKQYVVVRTAD